jgi:signal transduction histidine kinase
MESILKKFGTVLVAAFILFIGGQALAAEKATEAECIAKCEAAAAMVKEIGLEATLEKVADKNGPFVWKDTYIFCIDIEKGWNVADPIKPGLVGKRLTAMKDSNGKMFFAEFINVAKGEGKGWVDYMWPKVNEKKPSLKRTYVYRVPGENVAMLAGIYLD